MSLNSTRPIRILICDDDPLFIAYFKRLVEKSATPPNRPRPWTLSSVTDPAKVLEEAATQQPDLLLLDIRFKPSSKGTGSDEGLRLLTKLREAHPELPVVMVSGVTDLLPVRTAMQEGAWDFIPKGASDDEVLISLERVIQRLLLSQQREQGDFEISEYHRRHQIVGQSPAIKQVKALIEKFRPSPANVLINGETGTGKEVVARQLRKIRSNGSLEPFIAVDSSTIQSTIAESVLFGHQKGTFTGAENTKKGLFEEADGGVIYFDEVANMPLDIQAKLLRVIQEKEVLRLGSSTPIPLTFRVIAATNLDLDAQVAAGKFKADLLERLRVLPLELPPLRDRKEDIPLLIEHFLGAGWNWTPEALKLITSYPWPGNIRELSNTLIYVSTLKDKSQGPIEPFDLPPKLRRPAPGPQENESLPSSGSLAERLRAFEESILRAEWEATSGQVSKMAERLGMDRSNLHKKLKSFGVAT